MVLKCLKRPKTGLRVQNGQTVSRVQEQAALRLGPSACPSLVLTLDRDPGVGTVTMWVSPRQVSRRRSQPLGRSVDGVDLGPEGRGVARSPPGRVSTSADITGLGSRGWACAFSNTPRAPHDTRRAAHGMPHATRSTRHAPQTEGQHMPCAHATTPQQLDACPVREGVWSESRF